MIYLFYGTDIDARNRGVQEFLDRFDHEVVEFSDTHFSETEIASHAENQGLFSETATILLRDTLQQKELASFILDRLPAFAASGNIFVVVDRELSKDTLAALKEHTQKTEVFDLAKKAFEKQSFNVFSLTDALAMRDKKRTWVLYQESKRQDVEAEQVHGILFWQIKSLLLVKDTKGTPEEVKQSGLNPFVYKKALAAAKHFSKEELNNMSIQLTDIYHNARKGRSELSVSLEQFILSL